MENSKRGGRREKRKTDRKIKIWWRMPGRLSDGSLRKLSLVWTGNRTTILRI